MGRCIDKIKHDECGSYALQIFEQDDGTVDGYCFRCCKPVANPYGDKPAGYRPALVIKSPEEIQKEIEEVSSYRTIALAARKLSKETLEYFGIRVGVSTVDGETPYSVYFPYKVGKELIGYKARILLPKRMWAIGTTKGADFFGWEQAVSTGAKRVFITEGELDAASLFEIATAHNRGTQWAHLKPAVVSLVNGVNSAKRDITANIRALRDSFKEIVLVFDMDEPGKKAAEEIVKLFPDIMVVQLPDKDVNECLMGGRSNAAYNACFFRAKKPRNTRLISGESLHEEAKVIAEFGVSWPWKHLTKVTRGIRLGETIYIGAGQKQGKSEIVNTLAAHFIKEHGWKVFLIKPEESNKKTYKLVAGKCEGKFFHDPNIPFDYSAYDRAGEVMAGKLTMLDLYQHVGWDTLKDDIRMAASDGCKAIIIDPITNLTNGMDAASANTKLQEIAQELSAMALDLNVVIFIFCHLRNPDSGPPHERGGEVLSSQFAGSRAMARSCNLMLGLEGNRDPHLQPEERNLRTLILLEDREYGEVGRFKLYWDKHTGLFNEIT